MMADKIATRVAYGDALLEMGHKHPQLVVLDADLSICTMTKKFSQTYPERFYNCGIAEANMIGIAAGLATCGLKPFVNTFAIFASGRVYEQIRNSIGYPHLSVVVVGSHGGVSVGEDGATHQCTEDFALMRQIPGMMVCCPCDEYEMKRTVEQLITYDGPAYLRLARPATQCVTNEQTHAGFSLGKGLVLREGKDISVLATGIMVPVALQVAEILAAENIELRVIDIHTIKPLDEELILRAAEETGAIVTSEEHSIVAGLGGAVCELLGEACVPVVRHGVEDTFGRSGTASAVTDYFGLNAEVLAQKCRKALRLKQR